jgi:hypothetical protein
VEFGNPESYAIGISQADVEGQMIPKMQRQQDSGRQHQALVLRIGRLFFCSDFTCLTRPSGRSVPSGSKHISPEGLS